MPTADQPADVERDIVLGKPDHDHRAVATQEPQVGIPVELRGYGVEDQVEALLEFRQRLRETNLPGVKKAELATVLEPFVEFVDSFESVNDREILKVHDRQIFAEVGVLLETAISVMETSWKISDRAMASPNPFSRITRTIRKLPTQNSANAPTRTQSPPPAA